MKFVRQDEQVWTALDINETNDTFAIHVCGGNGKTWYAKTKVSSLKEKACLSMNMATYIQHCHEAFLPSSTKGTIEISGLDSTEDKAPVKIKWHFHLPGDISILGGSIGIKRAGKNHIQQLYASFEHLTRQQEDELGRIRAENTRLKDQYTEAVTALDQAAGTYHQSINSILSQVYNILTSRRHLLRGQAGGGATLDDSIGVVDSQATQEMPASPLGSGNGSDDTMQDTNDSDVVVSGKGKGRAGEWAGNSGSGGKRERSKSPSSGTTGSSAKKPRTLEKRASSGIAKDLLGGLAIPPLTHSIRRPRSRKPAPSDITGVDTVTTSITKGNTSRVPPPSADLAQPVPQSVKDQRGGEGGGGGGDRVEDSQGTQPESQPSTQGRRRSQRQSSQASGTGVSDILGDIS